MKYVDSLRTQINLITCITPPSTSPVRRDVTSRQGKSKEFINHTLPPQPMKTSFITIEELQDTNTTNEVIRQWSITAGPNQYPAVPNAGKKIAQRFKQPDRCGLLNGTGGKERRTTSN